MNWSGDSEVSNNILTQLCHFSAILEQRQSMGRQKMWAWTGAESCEVKTTQKLSSRMKCIHWAKGEKKSWKVWRNTISQKLKGEVSQFVFRFEQISVLSALTVNTCHVTIIGMTAVLIAVRSQHIGRLLENFWHYFEKGAAYDCLSN